MIQIGRFKKIILFLNATSFKLANVGHYKEGIYNNNLPLALVLIFCLEFSTLRLLSLFNQDIKLPYFSVLLPVSFIFHLFINVIFNSDLRIIEKNYKRYYGQYYFIIYCIVIVPSVIYTIIYLFIY